MKLISKKLNSKTINKTTLIEENIRKLMHSKAYKNPKMTSLVLDKTYIIVL